MKLIHSLYYMLCNYNIECRAEYIRTEHNVWADALSRLDIQRFRSVLPSADKVMTFPKQVEYLSQ